MANQVSSFGGSLFKLAGGCGTPQQCPRLNCAAHACTPHPHSCQLTTNRHRSTPTHVGLVKGLGDAAGAAAGGEVAGQVPVEGGHKVVPWEGKQWESERGATFERGTTVKCVNSS